MPIIHHRGNDGKALFDYPKMLTLDDSPDRIVFLSRRDFYILLNAIETAGKFKNRLYTSQEDDIYTIASPEQFEEFKLWVEDLENHLGEWTMTNEFLERIAISLESLDEKAQTFITWQDILDDLATSLGVGNAFYLLLKAFSDLIPSIKNVKLNPWPMVTAMWRTKTFEAPLLAAMMGINASLATMAAAAVGEKINSLLRTLIAGFDSVNSLYDQAREAILGDWNLLDFMQSLFGWLISDGEGGEGGEAPDTDPENRTVVNVATNIQSTILLDCESCGVGTPCTCGNSSGFSPGSGSAGPFPALPTTSEDNGTVSPIDDYEDYESYREYKCNVAGRTVDRLVHDLMTIGTWSIIGSLALALATTLAGVLLTPIPFDDIVFIVSILLIAGTVQGSLQNASTALGAEDDTLKCALFNASNVEQAKTDIMAEIVPIIEALELVTLIEGYVLLIIDRMIKNDVLNQLFDQVADHGSLVQYDCADCSLPLVGYTVILGTETSDHPSNPITIEFEEETGYSCSPSMGWAVNFDADTIVDVTTFVRTEDYPYVAGGNSFYYYSEPNFGGTVLLQTDVFPQDTIGGAPPCRCFYISFCPDTDMDIATIEVHEA